MATANKNLSSYNPETVPDGKAMKIGIVASEWNGDITQNLVSGAVETLKKHGVLEENMPLNWVPGSFELPVASRWMLESQKLDAVICIGSVIQGETKHFDFVCQAVSQGVKDVSLATGKPVIFGVLTDNTQQQAIDRSGGKHGNKGDEAAITALKMVALRKELTQSNERFSGYH